MVDVKVNVQPSVCLLELLNGELTESRPLSDSFWLACKMSVIDLGYPQIIRTILHCPEYGTRLNGRWAWGCVPLAPLGRMLLGELFVLLGLDFVHLDVHFVQVLDRVRLELFFTSVSVVTDGQET